MIGRHPLDSDIREQTQCTIVAIERDGEVIMDIPSSLIVVEGDELYICGTIDNLNRFYEAFGEAGSD